MLPGAQQLELLRRINLAHGSAPLQPGLADRVLATTAAGRGKADLPLVGLPGSGFGPAPVDPATVGAHELLRVASVLVADDLVALGPDAVRTSWARPWRRRFRLVGDPVLATGLREHLRGLGRPEEVLVRTSSPSVRRSTSSSRAPGPSAASSTAASRGRSGCASGASATSCRRASTSPTPYAAGTRGARSSGSSPTSTACPASSAYGHCRPSVSRVPTRPSSRVAWPRSWGSVCRPPNGRP